MNKVNLFIVGAPKCGTTSLYNYIDKHPNIFFPKIKEPNYFSHKHVKSLYYHDQTIDNISTYENMYKALDTNKYEYLGDSSVSYLFYNDTAKKIYDYNKDAKIIIMLRHPVERAYSHYLMDKRSGYIKSNLSQIIYESNQSKNILNQQIYQQIIELGHYYNQVKFYLDIFERKNIQIIFFDDFKNNTELVTNNLLNFLDLDSCEIDFKQRYNEYMVPKNKIINRIYRFSPLRHFMQKIISNNKLKEKLKNFFLISGKKDPLDNNLKIKLYNYYKEDIEKLEKLLNKDLTHWKYDV